MRGKKLLAFVVAVVLLAAPFVAWAISIESEPTEAASPTTNAPIKVACIGDSITEESQYPYDLQVMLGSNYTVRNFGSKESTVLRISWKPYMNQTEFQKALEFDPDIVVIMLGTNDGLAMLQPFNSSFYEDYTTLVNAFQALDGDEQIYIVKSPPIFSDNSDLNSQFHANTIIPKMQEVADKMNLPVIDVYNLCSEHPEYFEDGVHPNSQGAALIAFKVYDAINQIP